MLLLCDRQRGEPYINAAKIIYVSLRHRHPCCLALCLRTCVCLPHLLQRLPSPRSSSGISAGYFQPPWLISDPVWIQDPASLYLQIHLHSFDLIRWSPSLIPSPPSLFHTLNPLSLHILMIPVYSLWIALLNILISNVDIYNETLQYHLIICTNPRNKETCAVNSLLLRNCDMLWCCAAFWLILLCMLSLHVYLCLSPGSFWIWIKCSSTNGMDVGSVVQSRPQFKQRFWKISQLFEGVLWKTGK